MSTITNINTRTSKTMALLNNSKLLIACLAMLVLGLWIKTGSRNETVTAQDNKTEQVTTDTTRNAEMAVER